MEKTVAPWSHTWVSCEQSCLCLCCCTDRDLQWLQALAKSIALPWRLAEGSKCPRLWLCFSLCDSQTVWGQCHQNRVSFTNSINHSFSIHWWSMLELIISKMFTDKTEKTKLVLWALHSACFCKVPPLINGHWTIVLYKRQEKDLVPFSNYWCKMLV